MKSKISIFIPTKNAGRQFHHVLNQISNQKEKDFEIIIVDSDSTDQTLEITKKFSEKFKLKFPIKVYKIKPEEFGHGKTRNFALKYANKSSKFIVFLTQDAIPANNQWLSSLIENFKDKKVAGVFSRQIPKKNARETEKFFYNYYFPDKKIIKLNKKYSLFPENIFFSNVSSAIKKDLLKKYPFDESLIMSEDQKWAKDVIEKGYKTIYEPKSAVIHSHNYSLKQIFQRYFDSTMSLNEIEKGNFKNFIKIQIKYFLNQYKYVLNKNTFLVPYFILYDISKNLGAIFGLNEKRLPLFLKKTFSMHKYYWE